MRFVFLFFMVLPDLFQVQFPGFLVEVFLEIVESALEKAEENTIGRAAGVGRNSRFSSLPCLSKTTNSTASPR